MTDTTALVTGGSRGIGRAITEALLETGWTVYLCASSIKSAEQAQRELGERFPGRAHARKADIGNQQEAEDLVAWVESESHGIDCLVNNAGIGIFGRFGRSGRFGSVDQISADDWRRSIDTNLSGPFYLMRVAVPHMRRRGSGWIVNIGSISSHTAFAGGAAYNASKFGLLGLTEAAMLDLRQDGIRVTAVLPGSVSTEFVPGGSAPDKDWKLTPEDVAKAVTDLLAYPGNALPSRIELRPAKPPK